MATRIQLRRDAAAQWVSVNPILAQGEIGLENDTNRIKIGDGNTAWNSLVYYSLGANLSELNDVTISGPVDGDFLRWNGSEFINDAINLGADTVGDYIETVIAGTGVTVFGGTGESASATISIGQDVSTSASVTFATVSADLNGKLQTARQIALVGDVAGSVSFDGSQNVEITTTVQPESVGLSTDTTGDYVETIVAGTGVTVFSGTGHGSNPSVGIGQDVATNASVVFANVTADVIGDVTGNSSTASTLETTRTIELTGDVTGSVSFDGSQSVQISTTVAADSVALGTDTSGDYVEDIIAGTGVSITGDGGEGATPTIFIGQDVGTGASVTFAHVAASITGNVTGNIFGDVTGNVTGNVLGDLTGNADSASVLENSRTIQISGDVAGSAQFDGSADINISATVQPDSVLLGTDTVGDYIESIIGGTGVTIFGSGGEGASATVSIGQDVSTGASVTFAQLNTSSHVEVGGNLVVQGDLTINGSTTQLNTTELNIEDNIITLNAGVSGSPTLNAGIEVNRGSSDSVIIRWNETSDIFEFTNDGSVFIPLPTELDDISDVTFTSVVSGDFVKYDGSAWVNDQIDLGSDTVGNYVSQIEGGTGVTVFNGVGESSSVSIEIGQDVSTGASVTFSHVAADITGDVTGNSSTASTLQTGRTIELTGDITGSATFDGSTNIQISTTVAADSVALGTDTSGDYVESIIAGTGVSITGDDGEGSTPTIFIGQDVGTGASVTFANVTADLIGDVTGNVTGNSSTASTLETGRTISLSGDVTGSVTFNGSQNVDIVSTVQPNSVALGTDTTGNYIQTVVGGTGVTVFGVDEESASASVSIGQDVAVTADATFNSVTISSSPSSSSHAVTKAYVDNIAAGIDWHPAVRLATAAALPNSSTYNNGTDGVGATLTATVYARLLVDGTNATTGDRVLVKNEATATRNGVYTVTEQGSGVGEVYWVLTRSSDFDGHPTEEITTGEAIFVTAGSLNIRQGFVLTTSGTGTNGSHIVGTDDLSFTQFTGTQAFTAGDGLTQNGNAINVVTANSGRIAVGSDSIDLATVFQSNTSGSASTTFVTGVTVDDYGRVTGQATSEVNFNDTDLTGVPTAPTAALNTDTTQIASTEFVNDEIANKAILNTSINAKGDLIVGSANDTPAILAAGTNGFYLKANSEATNGLEWFEIPEIDTLNDIGDVTITNVVAGEFLKYDGNAWINDSIPEINFLSDVGDVLLSDPVPSGDSLIYNGTNWINDQVHLDDTEGMYLGGVTEGTGVTIFGGETRGTNASIAIGQDVATGASVTFAGVTLSNEPVDNDDATTKLYVDTELGLKSNLESPTFTGTPAAPTASAATNTTQIATTAFVRGEISALVGSAPEALDTLAELAAALNDDDDFATTVTNSLALKAPLASPTFTGTVTLPVDTDLREQYFDLTASTTLATSTHKFKVIEANSASAITLTVPTNASDPFPVGTVVTILRIGDGEVTIAASGGVTINNALGLRLRAQFSSATLRKRGTDTWLFTGDTKV